MPVNFRPHRQGATHIIEPTDVVLVRGTPVSAPGFSTIDTRICIRAHGVGERAMWGHRSKHVHAPGPRREFHLWTHNISESNVQHVLDLLTAVWREFDSSGPQRDGQDVGITMSFWAHDDRFSAFLHQPGDLRSQYSDALFGLGVSVWIVLRKRTSTWLRAIALLAALLNSLIGGSTLILYAIGVWFWSTFQGPG